MSLLGIRLNLLLGPTVAVPAPRLVIEALDSVEVTHKDEGRSGFQLTFRLGRSGPKAALDHPILAQRLVQPNMRAIVTVIFGATPRVLSDGIITHQQLVPGQKPGDSKLVVTGEDVSLAMDREELEVEHPAQDETLIALKICASYAQFGLVPKVIPPLVVDPPIVVERIPVQRHTDLGYLKHIASRYGYVFYVKPGSWPGLNEAYWGPPIRAGAPQRALSVDMGPATNVESIDFSFDGERPARVSGFIQDRITNEKVPVATFLSTRIPLVSEPPFPFSLGSMRVVLPHTSGGLNAAQAFGRAQGVSDASTDQVVKANGELDAVRYNDILEPRGLVGLRGAGRLYDGLYYVKEVTHHIAKERYRQKFQLTREGLGTIVPSVRP